jgi:hypothetical protein
MKRDALELAVDYYNLQLELKERLAIFEEIIEQFCMDSEAQPAPQQDLLAPPEPPSDENIADAWISASDSDGIAYDGPSFERGYRLGRGEYDEYTGALVAAAKQEPVAWANPNDLQNFDMKVRTSGGPLHTVPLCLCAPAPQQEPKYKVAFVDDQHPNGVPLAQWCNPQQPNHTEPSQTQQAMDDALRTGTGVLLGDKRIDPESMRKSLTDFDARGLAAKLTCWHRLTGQEADELAKLFIDHIPDAGKMVSHPQINGWIKKSELDQAKKFGGSINLWLERHDCDTRVFIDAAHGIKDNT